MNAAAVPPAGADAWRSVERALLIAGGLLAPLFTLRVPGVNFTLFDGAIAALFGLYVWRRVAFVTTPGYVWASLVFLIGTAMASAFALRADFAVGQLLQWGFIVAVAIPSVWTAMQRCGNAPALITGFSLGACFLVLHSAFELATGRAQFEGGRYMGILQGSQPMSFALSMLLPYVLVQPFVLRRRAARLAAALLVPLVVLGTGWLLLLTASRTAFGATFISSAMLLALVPLSRRPGGFSPDLKRLLAFSAFGFLAVVAVVTVLNLSSDSVGGLLRTRLVEKTAQSATSERFLVYFEVFQRADLRMLLHGVGPESYAVYSAYGIRPHNIFLIMLAEGGVVTLAGFLALLALPTRLAIGFLFERHRTVDPETTATAAAVVAFAVFLMIASLNTQSIHRIYWVSYAVALGLLQAPWRSALSGSLRGPPRG